MLTTTGTYYIATGSPQSVQYAWGGFNFMLYSIGIAILIGAATAAYTVLKKKGMI